MNARAVGRVLDLVLTLAILPLALPLMAGLALWIRLDSAGPAIHAQPRVGRGGRAFRLHKLRSMRAGPDPGRPIAPVGDRRITRAGRFLRRWRLDELPQLFDVLRGAMSLVGPRPERRENLIGISADALGRLQAVRPGLTGPAAIDFLAEDEALATVDDPLAAYRCIVLPAKVRIELDYLARWSLCADLRILAQTLARIGSAAARRRSLARIQALLAQARVA